MNKKIKVHRNVAKRQKLKSKRSLNITISTDSVIVIISAIMLFFTTLFIRLKVFENYVDFNKKPITAQNIFTYYRLISIIVLSLIIAIVYLYKIFKEKRFTKDYILICSGLIILSTIVSTIFSANKVASLWGIFYTTNGLISYVCLFVILYVLSNLEIKNYHITIFAHAINIVSIIVVLIAILEVTGNNLLGQYWFLKYYIPREYLVRLKDLNFIFGQTGYSASLMANFDYFGAYCGVFFPLIASLFITNKNIFSKVAFGIGSAMLFIGIIISGAAASHITTVVILIAIPILYLNRKNYISTIILYALIGLSTAALTMFTKSMQNQQVIDYLLSLLKSTKGIVMILICAVVYAGFLFIRKYLVKFRYIISKSGIIAATVAGVAGFTVFLAFFVKNYESIFSGRGYIWHHTWDLITKKLIGYGPDTLYYNFPQMTPMATGAGVDIVTRPHNIYLQFAFDTGIVGLVAFLVLMVMFLLSLIKKVEDEKDIARLNFDKAMILVVIAYLIQGLANDNHLSYSPILFALLGIGMAVAKSKENT